MFYYTDNEIHCMFILYILKSILGNMKVNKYSVKVREKQYTKYHLTLVHLTSSACSFHDHSLEPKIVKTDVKVIVLINFFKTLSHTPYILQCSHVENI